MELSSLDFHKQALNIIQSSVKGAKEYGLELSTMPPQLCVVCSKPIICDSGHEALEVYSSLPEILQDVDPLSWSWLARTKMYEEIDSEGFVFWCLVADANTSEETIFCFSYRKGGDMSGYLCAPDFSSVRFVNPYELIPYLEDDYEAELVVH